MIENAIIDETQTAGEGAIDAIWPSAARRTHIRKLILHFSFLAFVLQPI